MPRVELLRQCAPDQLPAPRDGRRYLWKPGSSRETDEIISAANVEDSVAVVVTTYNDAVYLRDALSSVFAQERHADEVIVVDDGSTVSPAPIVAEFPTAILLRKNNGGLSSARNLGLHRAHCRYITSLDADDKLEPTATASGLACFARRPGCTGVIGWV